MLTSCLVLILITVMIIWMVDHNQDRTNVLKELSEKQKEVLDFLINFLEKYSYPPTIRDIKEGLKFSSTSLVAFHLNALEEKSYIKRDPKVFRGVKILRGSKKEKVTVRLVGEIRAGTPSFAEEWTGESLEMNRKKLPIIKDNLFALRVRGDSMIKEGILPGDFIVISPQRDAENGDIVIALLGEEATLKKFHRFDSYVALIPANPKFEASIIKEGEDLLIQGKMIARLSPSECKLKIS